MVTSITFDELLKEVYSVNPELANYIKTRNFPKVDLKYLVEYALRKNIKLNWKKHEWWGKMERGVRIPSQDFFNAWIPGWPAKEGPFFIVTMSSYLNGKVYSMQSKDLLHFHDHYIEYSGRDKYLQNPGDYVAYDKSTSQIYLLDHEGNSTNFNLVTNVKIN